VGGPIAFVKDGDQITIDADAKQLNVALDENELARRKAGWVKPQPREKRGVLAKYAQTVRSASEGAVTG
jgi:dihydroxy-acid dehydratase